MFIHIAQEHLGGAIGPAAGHGVYQKERQVDGADDEKGEGGADVGPYKRNGDGEKLAAVARAFGKFARQLDDFPAVPLHETIPDFHDTLKRFEAFETAVAEDVMGRAAGCRKEIEFAVAEKKNAKPLSAGKNPENCPFGLPITTPS